MGLRTIHTTPLGRRIEIDSDVLDLDRRVKEGDVATGWRGDPEMWLSFEPQHGILEVWGLDQQRVPYLAAAEPQTNPNWRNDLLVRLRQGDWQRGQSVIDDLLAARDAKVEADEKRRDDELTEKAEKLAWAIQKDADGTSMYGTFFPGKDSGTDG